MKQVALTAQRKRAIKSALWGNAEKVIFREIETGQSLLMTTQAQNLLLVIRFEGREMVIVAAVGKGVYNSRQEIINFAMAQGMRWIRWHTRHPEHLAKATAGLPIELAEVRKRLFGRNEYIFKLQVM